MFATARKATPGDNTAGIELAAPDPRIVSEVIRSLAWIVGLAGVIWGTIYVLIGVPSAGAYPYAFSVLTVLNALTYRRHRRQLLFGGIQIALVLIVPAALAIHLGGFVASGAVGLWSLVGPMGALLIVSGRAAGAAFVVFVALVAVEVWLDGTGLGAALPAGAADAFFFLNSVGVGLVAFSATRIFLAANQRLAAEQQRLRAMEKAYVAQEAMLRQQERLATLGKLSAGVAHELNNPAAAVGRATGHLGDVIDRLIDDAIGMLGFGISPEGLDWVRSTAGSGEPADVIDRADREERIARWLEMGGVDDAWDLAPDLAGLGFDVDSLDSAAERYRRRQITAALRWIADVARAHQLIGEVRTGTGRIAGIVGALKGYSHMDRAEATEVDLVAGLEDTLVILRSQLTGIEIERNYASDLPQLEGNPGELNQVWTNLVANAAEALDGSGTITIGVRSGGPGVVVEIIDDGPGIPEELVGRVFDPFVTTKAPGEGTGLGLNLVHQIVVDHHGGSVDVASSPGRTRFVVTLPAEDR